MLRSIVSPGVIPYFVLWSKAVKTQFKHQKFIYFGTNSHRLYLNSINILNFISKTNWVYPVDSYFYPNIS